MIRKLRRRFIAISMLSMVLVVIVIVGAVNLANFFQFNSRTDSLLAMLVENEGVFPEFKLDKPPRRDNNADFEMTEETRFETRYFFVKANQNKEISYIYTGHIAAVSSNDASNYAKQILEGNKTNGYIGDNYRYLKKGTDYGSIIMFVDCRQQIQASLRFMALSLAISLLGFIIVFVLVWLWSKRAIAPVIATFEKQKQFITDAGHEIKTPLAIISANAEVIEMTSGGSEWTNSIKNQTIRLGELVKNLLTLSKMEEDNIQIMFTPFSISDAVTESVEPFKVLAEGKNQTITIKVDENISYNGDEQSIRQLVSILMDNAVKYAGENGVIDITLVKTAKTIKLSVANTATDLKNGDLNCLFDRFYRADSSRARESGGYGIGLSIANAIVLAHKGRISAVAQDGVIYFVALL